MNNGVNNSNNNQSIPGVVVAPPTQGVASNAGTVNNQTPGAPVAQQAPMVYATITPVGSASVLPVANGNQAVQRQPIVANNVSVSGNQVVGNSQIVQQKVVPTVPVVNQNVINDKPKKTKNRLASFLIIIVLILIGVCVFLTFSHQQQLKMMEEKCTPVSTTSGSKELDLDSTIVRDLYSKVETTLREDLGQHELNDELKIYLAYRQIPTSELYDSHCNMFTTAGMEPFTCELTTSFVPKAFKEETLQLEIKKLFGEDTEILNQNIQLGNTCIGGFQYIKERGEYVQGQCQSTGATMYRVTKELISATSTESTIVLKERVKYYGAEGLEVPERLRSGVYVYTFKLDMNYNYVYVSKTFEE